MDLSWEMQGMWKALRKLKVPPKVKVFLWRAAQNCLPMRDNLLIRRVDVGDECGVCGRGYENSWHMFIACAFAEEVWDGSPLNIKFKQCRDNNDDFIDFLENLLELKESDMNAKGAMIIWQIWRDRNDAVWKDHKPQATSSINMAANVLCNWLEAHNPKGMRGFIGTSRQSCTGWHDLDPGWMRCGVNVAFFANSNTTGIGLILQNEKVEFVEAKVKTLQGCLLVDEGETMGLFEALSWIKQKGIICVEFISDSKLVVDALASHDIDGSEFGAIINSCRLLIQACPSFRVKFRKHDANVIAHKLAKMSKDFPSTYVWDEPPSNVESLLLVPCVCDY